LAVWLSANPLVLINEFTLLRALLLLGCMGDRSGVQLPVEETYHSI